MCEKGLLFVRFRTVFFICIQLMVYGRIDCPASTGGTPWLLFWLRRTRKLGSLVFVCIRNHVRFIRK